MTELVTPEMIETATGAYIAEMLRDKPAGSAAGVQQNLIVAALEAAAPLIAEEVKERCAKFVETHTVGRANGEIVTAVYRSTIRETLGAAIRRLNVTVGE